MALLERLKWRLKLLRFALTALPVAGGSPEGDDPPAGDPPKADPPKSEPPSGDPPEGDDPDDEPVKPDDDWQAKARKHERAAKRERKERERLEAELKKREDENKSEQQKAIDKAKEEGRTEALTEAQKERRHDRLEAKCATVAARGITVKDGDDEKTLKFADPDDALVYIERAIREGDVEEDDIFDSEGKVNTDALTDALGDLLKRKPHLAGESNGSRPSGSADGGRGTPDTDLESMTPEDHAKRKYAQK